MHELVKGGITASGLNSFIINISLLTGDPRIWVKHESIRMVVDSSLTEFSTNNAEM